MWFAPALWHRAGANPWSSLVEGDEFNINTIAFCLGWCSLHLLLLKSSLAHVNDLEQQINTLLMLRLSRQRGMQVRRILFKIYSRLSGWRLPTFEPDPGRIVDIPERNWHAQVSGSRMSLRFFTSILGPFKKKIILKHCLPAILGR